MTRAERRRLEKLTGCKQAVYQYTAAQIEEIKRQAVAEYRSKWYGETLEEAQKNLPEPASVEE